MKISEFPCAEISRILAGSLVLALLICLLAGCVAKVEDAQLAADRQDYVWQSDEGPAVRWLAEIRTPDDAGLKESFFKRLQNYVLGRKNDFISRPYAVYAEGSRLLCVSDPGSGIFHLYDIENGNFQVVDKFQDEPLVSPLGISGDGNGNLFLTDSARGRIYRYDLKKNNLELFNGYALKRPTGIAFNSDNWLLYVSDTLSHQIVVFGLDGDERFRFGQRGVGQGELNFPTDLWIDGDGRLLVTDSMNARIQIFSPNGEFLEMMGQRGHAAGFMDKPKGVATDSRGYVYICDALKDSVQVFADGRFVMKFGSRGQGVGQFWMPAGIFIDSNDRIYVADSYNHRIQVFESFLSNRNDQLDEIIPGL